MKKRLYSSFVCALLLSVSGYTQEAPQQNPPAPQPSEPGATPERPPLPPPPPGEGGFRGGPQGPGRGQPGEPPGSRERRESDRDYRDRDRDRDRDSDRERGRNRDRERGPESARRWEGFAREHALKPTPYIGVVTELVPPSLGAQIGLAEGFGVLVANVVPDSPAQAAGLQRWDVLKLFNDQQLVSPEQLAALVRSAGKDAEANITLLRKGQEQKLTLKIGEKMLPAAPGAFPPDFMRNPDWRNLGPEFRERMEQFRRGQSDAQGGTRAPGAPREFDERLKNLKERLNDYQDAIRKWQEDVRRWQNNREGELPQPPPPPKIETPGPQGSGTGAVSPTDILRELRPGRSVQVRGEWSDGQSRWDAAGARVNIRIPEGEMDLSIKDGHRTLAVRNAAGDPLFNGEVDTPEQCERVPEPYRTQLGTLRIPPPLPESERERRGFRAGPDPYAPSVSAVQ